MGIQLFIQEQVTSQVLTDALASCLGPIGLEVDLGLMFWCHD